MIKIGFVGQPLPGCSVRLGLNNEIQIKHPALMSGYYKEPEMTTEAFTPEGYLKTGDEGFIDNDGYLQITGRVKDLFKTSKGKYVAPSPIEMKLSTNNDLEQVCIVGSGLPQPMALITLSLKGKKRKPEEVDAGLRETVSLINSVLDAHEKVYKIIIMQEEWTVENNLLTPSFKIKRNEIERKYFTFYEKWNESPGIVAWQNA